MDPQTTWTAARANRLLRPLASKITAFQKHIEEFQASKDIPNPAKWSNTGSSTIRSVLQGLEDTPEQDWIARRKGRRRRGIKYRAATSRGSQPHAKPESEDTKGIILSTPYMRKDLSCGIHFPSSPHWQDDARQIDLSSKTGHLKKPITLSLLQAFEHVFRATNRDHGSKAIAQEPGARSLSKMCLRLVPEHMLDEQQYRLSLDPDDRSDIPGEVYTDLEEFDLITFGHNSAVRRVVRAHAIHMFKSLMSNANIDLTSVRNLCPNWILQQLMPEEIEGITYTWMHAQLSRHATTSVALAHLWSLLLMPFQFLQDVQNMMRARDATLTYRILSRLISSRALCLEALGHPRLHYIWRGAMRSICMHTTESLAAITLVETALVSASGVCPEMTSDLSGFSQSNTSQLFLRSRFDWQNIDFEDEHEECFSALLNTVKGICVSLLAICHFKRMDAATKAQNITKNTNLAERVLRSATSTIERSYEGPSFARRAIKTGFPLIAAIVALAGLKCRYAPKASIGTTFEDRMVAFHEIRNLATSYVFADAEVDQNMTDFLLAVQDCVERIGSSTAARGDYEPYFDEIPNSDMNDNPKVDLATAYIFSLKGSASQDQETNKSDKPLYHPQSLITKPKTSHGFRWEEGIDEWVAMTPAVFTPGSMPRKDVPEWHLPQLPPLAGKAAAFSSTASSLSLDGLDDRGSTSDMDILRIDTDQTLVSSPPEPAAASSDHDLDELASPSVEESEDELAQQDSPSIFRARKRAHSGGGISAFPQRSKHSRLG